MGIQRSWGWGMTGLEVVAAKYLFDWAKQRVKGAADGVGKEVDAVFEAALGRLRQLVVDRLGANKQVEKLEGQGAEGRQEPSQAAVDAVAAALASESEDSPDFAARLAAAVEAVRVAEPQAPAGSVTAGDGGMAVAGSSTITANDHGIAVGVNHGGINHPPVPGTDHA